MAERTLWATLDGCWPAVCDVRAARSSKREGSTPQKAGAAMLVFPDGSQAGTLGGGCVEAEVRRRALAGLAEGVDHASLHTFLLDNDYGWDDGLICGGRMTVLADPVEPNDAATSSGCANWPSRVLASRKWSRSPITRPASLLPHGISSRPMAISSHRGRRLRSMSQP